VYVCETDGITIPPVHIITDIYLSHSLYLSCLYLFCPCRGSQRSCQMKTSVFIHTPHYHCPIIYWFGWFSDRCDIEDKINTLYIGSATCQGKSDTICGNLQGPSVAFSGCYPGHSFTCTGNLLGHILAQYLRG
jgi:hypothetical protein